MLASSDAVATANETHLFSAYLKSLFQAWRNFKQTRVPREIGLHHLLSEEEWRALIGRVASSIFFRMLTKKPGASVLLEKTPAHILHWRDILKIFPNAYFLHLVRDPRAVVASLYAARSSWWGHFPERSTISMSKLWKCRVEQGRKIRKATPNFLEVKYEDLKNDGETSLVQIFAWMGVECTLAESRCILKTCSMDRLKSGDLDIQPWNLSAEPAGFFRSGSVDAWRSELTQFQIWLVESITREFMAVYGYGRVVRPMLGNHRRLATVQTRKAIQALRWLQRQRFGKSRP